MPVNFLTEEQRSRYSRFNADPDEGQLGGFLQPGRGSPPPGDGLPRGGKSARLRAAAGYRPVPGRVPARPRRAPAVVVNYVAEQLGLDPDDLKGYGTREARWDGPGPRSAVPTATATSTLGSGSRLPLLMDDLARAAAAGVVRGAGPDPFLAETWTRLRILANGSGQLANDSERHQHVQGSRPAELQLYIMYIIGTRGEGQLRRSTCVLSRLTEVGESHVLGE